VLATAITTGGVASGDGGITAPQPPEPRDVRCLERCLDARVVTETGIAEITGKNLSAVNAVKLRSADGKVKVDPIAAKETSVKFKVPRGAISGKPVLLDEYGAAVASPVKLKVKPEAELTEVEGFELRKAAAAPKKTFFNGKRRSQVDYLFEAEGPTDIRIDVLKGKKRKLVDSIVKRDQQPFANNSARWDGLADSGKVAPNGKYKFEVTQLSGGSGERAKFRYYDHKFPLAGRHDYGDGLGAGRGHQGQDVFAKCGNPIYAARGGRVQVKASHSAAGNYIVIDGRKTGRDYVYMHMEKQGRPKQGSKVKTGDVIGYESDTGRATGCHLHFELWSSPGWYEGGDPINPTKPLKRWDKWS
jgi:murein DD-endopeptidase MepM/ murein hydrolase activator NlpD